MPLPDTLQPVAMLEAEVAYLPADAEGETGFDVRRLYLGGRWTPTDWASVVGSVSTVGGEHGPTVLDAYVRVAAPAPVEVTLGYSKTPLFVSARDQGVETLAIPELSMPTRSFWPGRDAGAEVHVGGEVLPVEGWIRVGNGSGSANGNDNAAISLDTRADLVLGRARADRERVAGLRVGGGAHLEDAEDRAGLTGETPTGFALWRSPTISGPVWMVEGHALALVGPVQVTAEGAAASEARSQDADGNPDTPRTPLDAVRSWGGAGEVAWMVTGQHRLPGAWPVAGARPGVEVAARGERLSLGRGASDVEPGGATGVEAAVRLWHPAGLGAGVTGGWFTYDVAPLEEPSVTRSWSVSARVTASALRPRPMPSAAGRDPDEAGEQRHHGEEGG